MIVFPESTLMDSHKYWLALIYIMCYFRVHFCFVDKWFIDKQNDRGIKKLKSFDFSVFNTLQKKSLKENGNGWEYTGNNYCDFTHNLHIIWVLPLGYFSVMDILERWLFKPSLISFFQTLYVCRVVLVCEYTVVSPATFKSVNLEFFRISGFYIKCSQSGFTGARQPDWHQNNPNPSTVHSTSPHGNSSVPICYYGLNQR